jgi:hypothetical protein
VPDPYDSEARSGWKLRIGLASATGRLRGLVRGRLRGIEVLRRGYSPRIVRAAVIGSAGRTLVSGPELAARLGLRDTWAFFSLRSRDGTLRPEPDRSGQKAAPAPQQTGAPTGGTASGTGAATPRAPSPRAAAA